MAESAARTRQREHGVDAGLTYQRVTLVSASYLPPMLRFFSSLLVLLLGATASPTPGPRPRRGVRLRGRVAPDDEGATDRALESAERPRARARQRHWRWGGAVELVHDAHTVHVPGRWTLESAPSFAKGAAPEGFDAAPFPTIGTDDAAWADRMRRILTLQEPGTRLRVGAVNSNGWQTLEVAVPTRPATIVQVDREAMGQLLGAAVAVRFRITP